MSTHNTESVTGLLDGELKGLRRWLAQRHVSACPVCATEYRRQRHVRHMLRANPTATPMSDSPEFFWAKVKADIQRRGSETFDAPPARLAVSDWFLQHRYAMATASAAVIGAMGVFWYARHPEVPPSRVSYAEVGELKTLIPNTAATTFDSEDAGVTVIWVTGLPWTSDMNEMKTEFANLDT